MEIEVLSFISDYNRYPKVNARILGYLLYLHYNVWQCVRMGDNWRENLVWHKKLLTALIGSGHNLTEAEKQKVFASFDFLMDELGLNFYNDRLLIGVKELSGKLIFPVGKSQKKNKNI